MSLSCIYPCLKWQESTEFGKMVDAVQVRKDLYVRSLARYLGLYGRRPPGALATRLETSEFGTFLPSPEPTSTREESGVQSILRSAPFDREGRGWRGGILQSYGRDEGKRTLGKADVVPLAGMALLWFSVHVSPYCPFSLSPQFDGANVGAVSAQHVVYSIMLVLFLAIVIALSGRMGKLDAHLSVICAVAGAAGLVGSVMLKGLPEEESTGSLKK